MKERRNMFSYAIDVIQDTFFREMMNNLSKIEDIKRYYNWYHGYTIVNYPYYDYQQTKKLNYFMTTSDITGTIKLKHYKEKMDEKKFEGHIYTNINIFGPKAGVENVTFHLEVDKRTIIGLDERDKMSISSSYYDENLEFQLQNSYSFDIDATRINYSHTLNI